MVFQEINTDKNIIMEAPTKKQQTWFVNLFNQNVNLGNIAPNDVLPLETLGGYRGDTFFNFLKTLKFKKKTNLIKLLK